MGKVIPMLGGGGGADLDVITAGAGDVLTGKVIVDRDGNSLTGTMRHLTNESTIQHAQGNGTRVVIGDEAYVSTNTDGVRRAEIRYNGGGGYIAGNTLLGVEQGKMAEAIGLTGDKLIAGSNVLGVAGDPGVKNTRDANLNPDYLVQGQSGYDDGVLKWGNMPDCGNWGANVGMNGSVGIPYGRHGGGGVVHGPSVPYQNADVAGTDRACATGTSAWDGVMCLGVRNGHYLNGVNWIQADLPGLQAGNIRQGINIGGLVGTLSDYSYLATGQTSFNMGTYLGVLANGFWELNRPIQQYEDGSVKIPGYKVWDVNRMILSKKSIHFGPFKKVKIEFQPKIRPDTYGWFEIMCGFFPKTCYVPPGVQQIIDSAGGDLGFREYSKQYYKGDWYYGGIYTYEFDISSMYKDDFWFFGIQGICSCGDRRIEGMLALKKIEFLN